MADETTTDSDKTQTRFERVPTYGVVYTNNVQIEHNAFDCKLIFGQFDGPKLVRQHVAVTMAWAEAKALTSLLLANIAFYEGINGTIQMPVGMKPTPPSFDGASENTLLKKVQDRIAKLQAAVFDEE